MYQSDKGFVPGKLPVFLAGATLAAVPLGALYQVLSFYVPCFGVVTVVLLGGYAALLGVCTGAIGKFAHNRNPGLHIAVALTATLVSYYTAWVVFSAVFIFRYEITGTSGVLYWPWDLWSLIEFAAEHGYFTIGSSHSSTSSNTAVSGAMLWAIWGIEALVIFGLGTFAGMGYCSEPYFPRTMTWGAKRKIPDSFGGQTTPNSSFGVLNDEEFGWLQGIHFAHGEGSYQFEFIEAPGEDICYLTVSIGKMKTVDKKLQLVYEPLAQYIELTGAQKQRVTTALSQAGANVPAPAPPANDDTTGVDATGKWDEAANPPVAPAKPAAPPAPQPPAKSNDAEWDS